MFSSILVKECDVKKWILRVLVLLFLLAFIGVGATSAAIIASHRTQPQSDSNGEDQEPLNGSCGVERWSVKTGTDADAGLVNVQSPVQMTIASLDSLPAPTNLPSNNRVQPTETTVFQLQVTLTEYKLEADSDYHLILSDGAGHTMISEMASPSCVGSSSRLLSVSRMPAPNSMPATHPPAAFRRPMYRLPSPASASSTSFIARQELPPTPSNYTPYLIFNSAPAGRLPLLPLQLPRHYPPQH